MNLPLKSHRVVMTANYWKPQLILGAAVREEDGLSTEENGNTEKDLGDTPEDKSSDESHTSSESENLEHRDKPDSESESDNEADTASAPKENKDDTGVVLDVSSSDDGKKDDDESSTADEKKDETDESKGDPSDQNAPADETATKEDPKPVEDKESPTLSSNVTSANNDTNAFMAFKLLQLSESDSKSDGGFRLVTLFENGAFVGPFAEAPTSTNIDAISSSETERWYLDNAYNDRISFKLDYTPDSTDYKISEPTIAVTSDSGIKPQVQDFQNDPENGDGSFTVVYRCLADGPEESYISLHLPVTGSHSVDTAWKKVCGRGRYEHVEFGFISHNMETVLFNKDGTYGTEEQKALEVGPLDTSTELSMKLVSPAYTLDFGDPYVASDSSYVSANLRNTVAGGTVNSDTATKFSVVYECHATETANIMFSVAIPPWDNITVSWRKDCGGRHSQSLLIGTNGPGTVDVIHDGELNSEYNITDASYIGDVQGSVKEIPGNVDYKRFYITNSDDTSEIQIQTPSMTMSDPGVVTTLVETPMVASSSYISATGATIERKTTKSLYLHFICKKEGMSLILVTLPVLRYKNIEFGFLKQCFAPKVHRQSGFLQTAGSLMAAIFFLVLFGGGAAWVYWRRRNSSKKYMAVSTSDDTVP